MTTQTEKMRTVKRPPARSRPSTRKPQQVGAPLTAQTIAHRAGLLAELPPAAKARAARWRALPAAERARILDEFYHLKLERPLSDLISENRR